MNESLFNSDEEVASVVLSQLDGSVQSQGVRVSAKSWLDLGSKDWAETNNETKAAAYQAAKATGWTDASIKDTMLQACPHILPSILDHTISVLQKLAQSFPVAVERVVTTTTEPRAVPAPDLSEPASDTKETTDNG